MPAHYNLKYVLPPYPTVHNFNGILEHHSNREIMYSVRNPAVSVPCLPGHSPCIALDKVLYTCLLLEIFPCVSRVHKQGVPKYVLTWKNLKN